MSEIDAMSIERERLAGGDDIPPAAQTLSTLLLDRFSCRAFLPDPVPNAVVAQMLRLAQMSPSWCNTQPWSVTVTRGAETERVRAALMADSPVAGEPDIAFPVYYPGVYGDRRREVGWQLYESVGVTPGDRAASARQSAENKRLFGAPHLLLIHSERELGTYGAVDCGVYLGTLILAAQSLGLGFIPQAALALHSDLLRRHFDIPENLLLVVGASFGYADHGHVANSFRSRRAPLEMTVTQRG